MVRLAVLVAMCLGLFGSLAGSVQAAGVEVAADGLSDLTAVKSGVGGPAGLVARTAPAAVGQLQGSTVAWRDVAVPALDPQVTPAAGGGYVWAVTGRFGSPARSVVRIDPATGSATVVPVATSGSGSFDFGVTALTAAPDGSAWALEAGTTLHHIAPGRDDRFVAPASEQGQFTGAGVLAEFGGALAVARDGRLWFQRPQSRPAQVGVIDPSGRQTRIALPTGSAVSALSATGADGMLVASGSGVLEYRADRLVHRGQLPGGITDLGRDADGRVVASTPGRGFTVLDSRLGVRRTVRTPKSLSSLSATRTFGLARSDGHSLIAVAFTRTALLRLSTRHADCRVPALVGRSLRAARAAAKRGGCVLGPRGSGSLIAAQDVAAGSLRPVGTTITAQRAEHVPPRCIVPTGALVLARSAGGAVLAGPVGDRYVACASGQSQAVFLDFSAITDQPSVLASLSRAQLAGGLVVAQEAYRNTNSDSTYTLLAAFDSATGQLVSQTTVGSSSDATPVRPDAYQADRAGRILYTATTLGPDGAPINQLLLDRPGQRIVLATGPLTTIKDLQLATTQATWTQDGVQRSAPL